MGQKQSYVPTRPPDLLLREIACKNGAFRRERVSEPTPEGKNLGEIDGVNRCAVNNPVLMSLIMSKLFGV